MKQSGKCGAFSSAMLARLGKSTHMSKEEWTRTCRRVAAEREEFMRERAGTKATTKH
jgi:hypothetical protein